MEIEPLKRDPKVLGIDLMGGDFSPDLLLDALSAVEFPAGVRPLFFVTKEWARSSLPCKIASCLVTPEERPLSSFKEKRGASLFLGLEALAEGEIDLFLSLGNTGSFALGAKTLVKMLPHCKKPALVALVPTAKEPAAVLDLGGHIEVKAQQLVEFAFLGAAYQKARSPSRAAPLKVGLLNIGKEPSKGTLERQKAHKILSRAENPHFTFVGNVEGREVFEGEVDVLLTDGFSGNIFLKTAEGLSHLLLSKFQKAIPEETLSALKKELFARQNPGALLAGLKRCAIKCHGHTSPPELAKAALWAGTLLESGFYPSFTHALEEIFLWKL